MKKEEGKLLDVETTDQKVIEVSTEIPEKDNKVEKEEKDSFEAYKEEYKELIDEKCLEDYGTLDDEKLREDIAKELFLKSKTYIPNEEDYKPTEKLDKVEESLEPKEDTIVDQIVAFFNEYDPYDQDDYGISKEEIEAKLADPKQKEDLIYNLEEIMKNMDEEDIKGKAETILSQLNTKSINEDKKVKTMDDWQTTLHNDFFVGDLVEDAIIDDFINSVPPTTCNGEVVQGGEPYSARDGKTTYTTFVRDGKETEGHWMFVADLPKIETFDDYKALVNKKEEASNNRLLIHTGLSDKAAENVLDAVVGQLSDGMWENTPSMSKYWQYMDIVREGNELCISIDNDSYSSGFRGKDEEQIRKWMAQKIKQIVKEEELEWDRNNTKNSLYIDAKVQDAYRVYDRLLQRKDRITLNAEPEEPVDPNAEKLAKLNKEEKDWNERIAQIVAKLTYGDVSDGEASRLEFERDNIVKFLDAIAEEKAKLSESKLQEDQYEAERRKGRPNIKDIAETEFIDNKDAYESMKDDFDNLQDFISENLADIAYEYNLREKAATEVCRLVYNMMKEEFKEEPEEDKLEEEKELSEYSIVDIENYIVDHFEDIAKVNKDEAEKGFDNIREFLREHKYTEDEIETILFDIDELLNR